MSSSINPQAQVLMLRVFVAQHRSAVTQSVRPDHFGAGDSIIPDASETVAISIPAELLRRRPDVRRVEREAAAQSAETSIAVSELYPHSSIGGSPGLEAPDFKDLFDGAT